MAAEPLERAQDLAALEESLGAAADGRGRLVRAEAAWLEGRHREAIEATEAAFEPAGRRGMPMEIGELACWRRRAGAEEEIPRKAAEPYVLQLAGDPEGAASLWREMGCPYESALALGDSDDEDALRHALTELQDMGASPAAAIVARRLRGRGARGLPRGPRTATRDNPAGLTPREVKVLGLVAKGLRSRAGGGRSHGSPGRLRPFARFGPAGGFPSAAAALHGRPR
jgi:hypothetical protein